MRRTQTFSSRVPVQKRSEATREKLLEAGIKQFSAQGYHRSTSKTIAREAGVSIGCFYIYFQDKRQLLLELYRRHVQTIHDMVTAFFTETAIAPQPGDGKELIRSIIEHSLTLHRFPPALLQELTVMSLVDPEFAAIGQAEEEQTITRIIDLLKAGNLQLRVVDSQAAFAVVGHTIEAVVHSLKMFGSDIGEPRMIEATVDMIHRFLFHEGENL